MTFNLADMFENAVDAFGDREYLVAEGERRTYAEMEERANRLAHHLAANGVGPGDHVGIYSLNSVEWVETARAVFKLRAVWIKINFRYVEDELRYLFTGSPGGPGPPACLRPPGSRRARRHARPGPRHHHRGRQRCRIPDRGRGGLRGGGGLGRPGAGDFGPRSSDDHYILYTGGTTGMPKGVVWRHEDVSNVLGRWHRPDDQHPDPAARRVGGKGAGRHTDDLAAHRPTHARGQPVVDDGTELRREPPHPGGQVRPPRVWRLVEAERANSVMITGDAMGKPLVEALDDPGASYDFSSGYAVVSTAALFSAPVKDEFFAHLPTIAITDAIGSSETGSNGMVLLDKDHTAMKSGPTVKAIGETVVLDENLDLVKPGSGVTGKIARTGDIPLGYYNDPVKTAEVFITIDGTRYVMPGDFATVEADGTITLLGRGSVSINSGGEKIYPEEVESAVRSHPDVFDAIVVGAPDERWGQRVAAIIEPRGDRHPSLEDIQLHCRKAIAGYKVPRQLHVVESIVRSPSGKPDYRWANAIVAEAPEETDAGGARTATGGD